MFGPSSSGGWLPSVRNPLTPSDERCHAAPLVRRIAPTLLPGSDVSGGARSGVRRAVAQPFPAYRVRARDTPKARFAGALGLRGTGPGVCSARVIEPPNEPGGSARCSARSSDDECHEAVDRGVVRSGRSSRADDLRGGPRRVHKVGPAANRAGFAARSSFRTPQAAARVSEAEHRPARDGSGLIGGEPSSLGDTSN
jgi:hypothetical protein